MKKQKQIRSNWMFCICAAITASAGWLGLVNETCAGGGECWRRDSYERCGCSC